MDWNGKTVWVTGASSGIGRAAAGILHGRGARLILSARNREALEKLNESLGGKHFVLPFDLAETRRIPEITREALEQAGQIDLLLLSGGISQRSRFLETRPEVERKILEVDFFANTLLARGVIPAMVKAGGGHIAVLSSLAGKFGFPMRSAYSAAKHALHGYFETIRTELHRENIRVTMVCPGPIRTNISINALEADGQPHNRMDELQQKSMSPEKCARKMLRAIEKNKKEVYIGGKEIILIYLKRFYPWLFNKIVLKVRPT